LRAAGSLTPAAAAAALNDHPSSNTLTANNRRLAGHVLAFLCNVTQGLLGPTADVKHPQRPGRPGQNNVAATYS